MNEAQLLQFWEAIPTGRENAVDYTELCATWKKNERAIRSILHELSSFDNGDDFILIRSSSGRGFYKTDEAGEIEAYRRECLNKGRSVFAPIKKINRVLNANAVQLSTENNLRLFRELRGLKQKDVCEQMKQHDNAFDTSLLSKMENGVCLPTFQQLAKLADIYGVAPFELIGGELVY